MTLIGEPLPLACRGGSLPLSRPRTLLGAQEKCCAPVARELACESELMGTAAALALLVVQCCSSPLNSMGHSFSDPQKIAFSLGNEEAFFFLPCLMSLFYRGDI